MSILTRVFPAAIALAAFAVPQVADADNGTDRLLAGWIDRLQIEAETIEGRMQTPATVVASGWMMRAGGHGNRVGQLTARLGELGYLADADRGAAFTPAVETAVRAFQTDRGLFVDGVVGPQTLAELNRTPRDSLTALYWTIAQMREMRVDLPNELLLINIPSTEAMLIRDGQVLIEMPAAVGRQTRQTPAMVDEIVNVTLNPRWSVPPTIMREDVLPKLREDGSTGISFATVMLDGEEVDPTMVDWSEVSPWRIVVRQSPGDHNALGRFLFSLTNDQNIFVHSTNHPTVFQRANRAVSSGCIRVEEARWLAEYLLARDGSYDLNRLDGMLDTLRTRVLRLSEPLPVYIAYWTASVEPNQDVVYHRDVYDMTRGYEPIGVVAVSEPISETATP